MFSGIQESFTSGEKVAVFGGNGSGKSTLLKVLAGMESATEGEVIWEQDGTVLEKDNWYKHLTFCSPYIGVYDDLSLAELFRFYTQLKPIQLASFEVFYQELALPVKKGKALKNYSSGMRQRVKLLLAISANSPVLFLDEPASNLDVKGIDWYYQQVEKFASRKTVFVASNSPEQETTFCNRNISILDFKAPMSKGKST